MEKKKSAEQMAQEHTADNLLSMIIAKTYSRHSAMTEEEFLKDIGFEGSGKTEAEAIRIGIFNIIVETTKQLLMAKKTLQTSYAIMELLLTEKGEKKNDSESK